MCVRECEKESPSIRENKPELCCINRGLEEKELRCVKELLLTTRTLLFSAHVVKRTPWCAAQVGRS